MLSHAYVVLMGYHVDNEESSSNRKSGVLFALFYYVKLIAEMKENR